MIIMKAAPRFGFAVTIALMLTGSPAFSAGKNNFVHNVEYADEWREIEMGKDLAKALAEKQKKSMSKHLHNQYRENGYALKYVPKIHTSFSLLHTGNKNLANVKFTIVYSTEEQAEDVVTTIVYGIKDDELHKVMCVGVSNPFSNKDCRTLVEEVYGKMMPVL